MAELALNNIHALRETFQEKEKVRVSAIITEGGDLVNVVPAVVKMQIMVRAFTIDGMLDASKKSEPCVKKPEHLQSEEKSRLTIRSDIFR